MRAAIAGGSCVALGLGAIGAASVLKGNEPAVATCASTTTVRVAAPAAVAPTIDDLTRSAEAGSCIDYQVSTVSAYDEDQALKTGAAAPDVWISDSPMWVQDAGTALGDSAPTTGPTIATSPVVVAVPQAYKNQPWAKGEQTWTKLLASTVPLTAQAPETSTPTMAALADANTQIKTENDRTVYFLAMLRLTRGVLPNDQLLTHASESSKTARAFVASEQEIVAYNQAHKDTPLGAVAASTGAPQLSYQLVYPRQANAAKALSDKRKSLLENALTSSDAKSALSQAGFRVPDGNPPAGSPVAADVTLAADPTEHMRVSTVTSWVDLGKHDRLLIAIDGSGSMGDPVNHKGDSRMSPFQGLAKVALGSLPADGKLGALGFSTKAGPSGVKWFSNGTESLATKGVKEHFLQEVGTAMDYVRMNGDTPLYDATWAAYNYMTTTYDPNYVNAVVVLTDGQNDNPAGFAVHADRSGRVEEDQFDHGRAVLPGRFTGSVHQRFHRCLPTPRNSPSGGIACRSERSH